MPAWLRRGISGGWNKTRTSGCGLWWMRRKPPATTSSGICRRPSTRQTNSMLPWPRWIRRPPMKPGEFVGTDGLVYGVIQAIRVFEMAHGGHSAGVVCIDHPDFALAVAALQALIQPKQPVTLAGVHPAVGLRWCGEEEFGWVNGLVPYRLFGGRVEYRPYADVGWIYNNAADAAFNAGREYERERG